MRLACSLAVAAVLAVAAHTAHAQPAMTAPAEPERHAKAKDPQKATNLSVLVPLATMTAGIVLMAADSDESGPAGAILFFGGGIVGPAAGHWYGGNVGGLGILVRTGATLGMAVGVIGMFESGQYECDLDEDYEACQAGSDAADRRLRNFGVLALGGLATFLVSAAYDMSAAGDVAESWNKKHGVTFGPTMLPASGGRAPGASLSLRF